jgi:muramoyltetrapeptide carboxypeptidase
VAEHRALTYAQHLPTRTETLKMHRRDLLRGGALALGAAALPLLPAHTSTAAEPQRHTTLPRILPRPLHRGDTVGLIAPSAAVADSEELAIAQDVLEALGFVVRTGEHAGDRRGHLAGRDEDRAADLNQMFGDPNIKAVICLRGGSGAARVLPLLDYSLIRSNPKPLLGYSDITALHNALLARAGLVSFHGPIAISRWNRFNVTQFERLFFERALLQYQNEWEEEDELVPRKHRIRVITPGVARGELVGGNLTVLTALAGSPYLPDFRGKILFLEDVDEAPYRIDRMLSTLRLMGALDQISGFVFGDCNNCTPGNGWGSLTLQQILEDYIAPLGIPAYSGAMIGHIPRQFILPVGAAVELDATQGTLRMLEPVFQAA